VLLSSDKVNHFENCMKKIWYPIHPRGCNSSQCLNPWYWPLTTCPGRYCSSIHVISTWSS